MNIRHLDFIWNISLVCPWDCAFCCVDAVKVYKSKEDIFLVEEGLTTKRKISSQINGEKHFSHLYEQGITPNIFDKALLDRQARGLELTYNEKLQVLKNILPHTCKIDFAGGDPLVCFENFLVIKEASKLFGKNKIAITATGASVKRYDIKDIASVIGKFEFTFDEPISYDAKNRPEGYNKSNLTLASKFALLEVTTKAQIPIHGGNLTKDKIEIIYKLLTDSGIKEILLMRTFPVGRGMKDYLNNWFVSKEELKIVIDNFRELETKYHGSKIKLQCALKHLDVKTKENPCDLVRESFGINPNGILLTSIWATNSNGNPLDNNFVIGNLSKTTMNSLLNENLIKNYESRLNENYGHCKIFAFMFSEEKTFDSIFSQSDPIYTNEKDT